jgi:hypothetical protein
MSNARDTTNFTTKCLQTDVASYVDITHKQLKYQIINSILTFNINKSLIVDVLLPYRMSCQFVSIGCKISCIPSITQLLLFFLMRECEMIF